MPTFEVPVGISNRHVHLSEEHIQLLFGPGYQLTKKKDLSQPGQYACEETVTLVGPKGSLEGVRVLGPARKASQVELAATDTFKVGVKPPVRDSGHHDGTPGIKLLASYGAVDLEAGVIIAARHIHMSPQDAQNHDLQNGERVRVQVSGPRAGIFENVLIRVSPAYLLDMHIDTDEGNAFSMMNGQVVEVLRD